VVIGFSRSSLDCMNAVTTSHNNNRRESIMLVLSRKVGQKVLIGEDIEVVVVQAKDGSLRLGITAPKSVNILRSELAEQNAALTDMPLNDLSHLNLAVV
jgi:carbon storage regulator CsrA